MLNAYVRVSRLKILDLMDKLDEELVDGYLSGDETDHGRSLKASGGKLSRYCENRGIQDPEKIYRIRNRLECSHDILTLRWRSVLLLSQLLGVDPKSLIVGKF